MKTFSPRFSALKRKWQRGSMMLEAMFGILIFSLGILALVGLQTSSAKQSVSGRYRTDAAMLANQLVGQMWLGSHALIANYATNAPNYNAWLPSVNSLLPGSDANPPTVVVQPTTNIVTITLFWKAPGEPASEPVHRFVMITQIL